jgi:radical SAM superfamily enzyme YgiQ (UPF0313 family)
VGTLHAVLDRAGIPVRSVIFKQLGSSWISKPPDARDIDALVGLVKQLDPLLVGMSVVTAVFGFAAEIAARLRRETGALILWGGIHPTLCPEDCLAHADAVCLGEGEGPLVELASALRAGQPFHHLRNLWFRHDGRIIKNEMRPLITNLDEVPYPSSADDAMFRVDNGRVWPMPPVSERLSYAIMTTRGCRYRCAYCLAGTLHRRTGGLGPDVRRHSVGYVIEELRQAKRTYPNLAHVHFWDGIFTLDRQWLREFAEPYRAEIGLPFFCYGHPLATPPSAVALLRKAGVDEVAIGIQSGSPRVRNQQYQRPETNEDILRTAATLRRFNVRYIVDLIIDNPLETSEDYQMTLDLLLRLPHPFALVSNHLIHMPDTPLTRMLLDRGAIRREDVEDIKAYSLLQRSYLLDLQRDSEVLFWDCLFYMASKRSFPQGLIRWLSRRSFVRRHPHVLARLLRLTSDSVLTIDSRSRLSPVRILVVGRLLKVYRGLQGMMRRFRGYASHARSSRS